MIRRDRKTAMSNEFRPNWWMDTGKLYARDRETRNLLIIKTNNNQTDFTIPQSVIDFDDTVSTVLQTGCNGSLIIAKDRNNRLVMYVLNGERYVSKQFPIGEFVDFEEDCVWMRLLSGKIRCYRYEALFNQWRATYLNDIHYIEKPLPPRFTTSTRRYIKQGNLYVEFTHNEDGWSYFVGRVTRCGSKYTTGFEQPYNKPFEIIDWTCEGQLFLTDEGRLYDPININNQDGYIDIGVIAPRKSAKLIQ